MDEANRDSGNQKRARLPWVIALLAPAFAMGWFYATRRRLLVSWILTVGIVTLVLIVHGMAQPWRGIVDAGVVVGLTWGMVSIVWIAARGGAKVVDPELPKGAA